MFLAGFSFLCVCAGEESFLAPVTGAVLIGSANM